ncbi:MAG: FtsX-like permease family protein [Gemmatimonadaceae bacterium]
MRQLLTESVLLALAGGALGLLVAEWGVHALLSLAPDELPRAADIQLDHRALFFALALSLATGVAFGLMPAWRAARTDVHALLKEGSGRASGPLRQGRARNALIIGEIALAIVLLVGAGLLLRTFANLVRTDPGFDTQHVLSAEIWLTGSRYDSTAAIASFYRRLTERIDALPGVRSSAVIEAGLPLERGGRMGAVVDGRRMDASLDYRTITPGLFQTLGVPLTQGRAFAAGDADIAEPVAIVNEALAHQLLSERDAEGHEAAGPEAVGHMVTVGNGTSPRRIVGVVGNVRSYIGLPAPPTVFIPSAQTLPGLTHLFSGWYPTHVIVRAAGDPAALGTTLARAIQETDPQVPIGRVRTMNEVLAASLSPQRFVMTLLGIFAGLAVVLAAVGIYGLMSFLVAQRTHEIGIRMAIGARARDVLRLIVMRAVLLTGTGVAFGVMGALLLTRLLEGLLFGVRPTDPLTFAGVAGVLGIVAIAASVVPARRAARVDPMIALRSE